MDVVDQSPVLINPEWWRRQDPKQRLAYVHLAQGIPSGVTATWHVGSPDAEPSMTVTWRTLAVARAILVSRGYARVDLL